MSTQARCTTCRHYRGRPGWCPVALKVAGHSYRRTCRHWLSTAPTIAEITDALTITGLACHVAELRDTPEGRRLRLRHGTPERERFTIYRLAGLGVIEPERIEIRRTKPMSGTAAQARQQRGQAA